jgi:hypothetical protein
MSFNNIFKWFSSELDFSNSQQECPVFNPANGLPMINNNCSGVDVLGNPFGTDINHSANFDYPDPNNQF